MDQKMILKFIFLFLTFSIEKSVSFKNELDSSIPHDDKTKSLSIKCGLECIFKCLIGNTNVFDYECLHVCLPNCTDVFKGTFEDTSKTKGQKNEDLGVGQLTIVQLCNLPCNSDEKQVAEVVCDFCKEVSSAFLEVYGNFTIHYGCTEIDPCPDPGKNTESSIQKWCKFCTAIKDWIDPNQPISVSNQIKELDPKSEWHWITQDCHILCQHPSFHHQLNCSDPDIVTHKKKDDIDHKTLKMKCNDMCRNDWKNNRTGFNDNEFCLDCYTSQDYIHLTIADYCKRIENPNWWCIQLKCATWEPYPDRRANHVENSKEVHLAPNLDDNQSTVVEDFRSLKIQNDPSDKNFGQSTMDKQKQPHWIEWDCQILCQLDKDTSSRGLQLNCSDPDLTKQTKIADLDERLNEICGGMCPDDIDNINEFCSRCKIFSPSEESVSQFCRKIEKPDWWCIQLKCAEWRPYTSYETEEEDEDSKPRPILSMSAGKNYSLKVSRSVYLI